MIDRIETRKIRQKIVGSFILSLAVCAAIERPIFAAPATLPATTQPATDVNIAALIEELGDDDLAVRDKATAALGAMGREAIVPLGQAARSDIPEVRSRARAVLRKLPWDLPDDPPPIAHALQDFGQMSVNEERQVVRWLAGPENPGRVQAWRAIGRLLRSYPDSNVLWECVSQIRLHPENGLDLGIGTIRVDTMNGPSKVVAARYIASSNPSFAAKLLIETLNEAPDCDAVNKNFDELTAVVEDLIKYARLSHQETPTAEIIRRQFTRVPRLYFPWLTRELYALHGNAGPLNGFARDLVLRPPNLTDPPTLYALAQLERRLKHPEAAVWLDRLAFDAVIFDPPIQVSAEDMAKVMLARRRELGKYLIDHGWYDQARKNLDTVLDAAGPEDALSRSDVYLKLASIDRLTGDDFLRGTHLRMALSVIEKHPEAHIQVIWRGKKLPPGELTILRVEMHWGFLRAAKKTNDPAAAVEHANALIQLRPLNDEILEEIWPVVKHDPTSLAAQAYFDANYDAMKQALERDEKSAAIAAKLAAMCARCGQHLNEARLLAEQAVRVDPGNGYYYTVLAETQFRLGDLDAAFQSEGHALKLRPTDPAIRQNMSKIGAALRRRSKIHPATKPAPAQTRPDVGQ